MRWKGLVCWMRRKHKTQDAIRRIPAKYYGNMLLFLRPQIVCFFCVNMPWETLEAIVYADLRIFKPQKSAGLNFSF